MKKLLIVLCIVSLLFLCPGCSSEKRKSEYDQGYSDGYGKGYDDGYKEGYGIGHDTGYEQGYTAGESDTADRIDDINLDRIREEAFGYGYATALEDYGLE